MLKTQYGAYTGGSNISLGTMLAGGADKVVKVRVDVPSGATAGATITDSASVSASETDPNTLNNSDSATTTIQRRADLSITKTDSPDPVNAGGTVTYTLTVHNGGPSDASGVKVQDTLPASNASNPRSCQVTGTVDCSLETQYGAYTGGSDISLGTMLAGGADKVVKVRVDVPSGATAGATITDSASVSASETDPNTLNNSDSATTTIQRRADLSITKTDSPDPVNAGGTVTYTLTVHNGGPSDASGVKVQDTLPASNASNPRSCQVT